LLAGTPVTHGSRVGEGLDRPVLAADGGPFRRRRYGALGTGRYAGDPRACCCCRWRWCSGR